MRTEDRRMKDLIQLAKTVAQSKATVIIQGESGTGKELMAQLIHDHSTRALKPFVAINCAAIPDQLLESELFGYEKGAFTGAGNSKAGKFELAQGGTLLLDEISEMDIRLQAKLLRAIQQGEIDRVGGSRPVQVDVRIIATTNKNLSDCVKEGTFREDLFYRLNVVNLTVPPLRERMGDIEILSKSFVEEFSKKDGKNVQGLTPDAIKLLNSHSWPGNVRELENVIERAVITCQGNLVKEEDILLSRVNRSESDFVAEAEASVAEELKSWQPGQTLDDIERSVILNALKYHQGNRTHTARALGISIRTLRNKLADYRRAGLRV